MAARTNTPDSNTEVSFLLLDPIMPKGIDQTYGLTGLVDLPLLLNGSNPGYSLVNPDMPITYDESTYTVNVAYNCLQVVAMNSRPTNQLYSTVILPIIVDSAGVFLPAEEGQSNPLYICVTINFPAGSTNGDGSPLSKTIKQGSFSNMGGIGVKAVLGDTDSSDTEYLCRPTFFKSITQKDNYFIVNFVTIKDNTTNLGCYSSNVSTANNKIICGLPTSGSNSCQYMFCISSSKNEFSSIEMKSITDPAPTKIDNNPNSGSNQYDSAINA